MQSNAPGPFIRSAFAPAVLVVSNQDVDEICKKNGSDFSFCSILEACGTTVPASRGTQGLDFLSLPSCASSASSLAPITL